MWLGLLTLVVMSLLALRANRRFRAHQRLPMQFGPGGQVGWSAQRPLALAFMPGLSALILVPLALATKDATGLAIAAVFCLSGQFFHLWLVSRTLPS